MNHCLEQMHKLFRILRSRFIKTKQESWIEHRRKICSTCPLNTQNLKNVSLKIKILIKLSNFYSFITLAKFRELGTCSLCGCPIFFKSQDKEEECEANKW